ncbi:MAG: DUF952 domain-containing protein [Bacteroidetes bacterium]|nr:MAG: DUF952 domain-containing protein [Bacteroidota bacterium]TAG92478.1 MAG: DUF952 domain-containing protein [Bacteroidota bacterium]
MIYHLTTQTSWENAQQKGFYAVESIQIEGFIHASQQHQVARSANVFFKDFQEILLLHIDENLLTSPLKFEKATDTNDDFPHIYGVLNINAVVKTEILKKNNQNLFQF